MAYPFFWVEREILDSPAYLDLGHPASRVLLHFLAKCQYQKQKSAKRTEWIISNNGDLVFSYQEARDRGLSSATFRNCLVELQSHGFLQQTVKGRGGALGMDHRPSRFALSDDWKRWSDGPMVLIKDFGK